MGFSILCTKRDDRKEFLKWVLTSGFIINFFCKLSNISPTVPWYSRTKTWSYLDKLDQDFGIWAALDFWAKLSALARLVFLSVRVHGDWRHIAAEFLIWNFVERKKVSLIRVIRNLLKYLLRTTRLRLANQIFGLGSQSRIGWVIIYSDWIFKQLIKYLRLFV